MNQKEFHEDWNSMAKDIPFASRPLFPMTSANEVIELFKGRMILYFGTSILNIDEGSFYLKWFPQPTVKFEFVSGELPLSFSFDDFGKTKIEIPDLSLSFHCYISSLQLIDFPNRIRRIKGIVAVQIDDGEVECDYVVFHLPNFCTFMGDAIQDDDLNKSWAGRFTMQASDWIVNIDEVQNADILKKELKASGGYAFMHVGVLRRSDNSRFKAEDARRILGAWNFYISFLRGLWCGAILCSGYRNEQIVWRDWSIPNQAAWHPVESWFPRIYPAGMDEIGKTFGTYLQKIGKPEWEEAFRLTTYWYVESNIASGGHEGAIILTQTAFELMSWVYLVESSTASMSKNQFKALGGASQKIAHLLQNLGIPTTFPSNLTELSSAASALRATNAIEAFVKIRNGLVHPEKSNRNRIFGISPHARTDAWRLGIWYLELILLRLLDYDDQYMNRLLGGYDNQRRVLVPWSTKPTPPKIGF